MRPRGNNLCTVGLAAALWALLSGPTCFAAEAPAAPDFAAQVAPLLAKYCVGCHGGTEPEGKLSLEDSDGIRKGGAHGPAIVAGDSGASRLIQVLTGAAEPKMPPPDNDAPAAEEIALLRAWIDAGAALPADEVEHLPLVTPNVPLRTAARQPITAIAYSPDGKLLAVGGPGRVRLLAADDLSLVGELVPHTGQVTDLAFSRDGARLVAAAGEPGLFGEASVWDVAGRTRAALLKGHRDSLYAVALSPDGALLATGGYDQHIILWDAAAQKQVRSITGHSGAVFDLDFSPDGRWLASAAADRTIKLWNAATGERLDTFGQPIKEQFAVAFRPGAAQLAAGGGDNRIRLYEIGPAAQEGTNPIRLSRFAHQGAVLKLAYSADGKLLASASDDRTVKLLAADDVQPRWTAENQSDWPAGLAFSPDGKRLAVGRLDGTLDVYDTQTGRSAPPPKPELAGAEPRGVQRGVTAQVRVVGKHLVGALMVETSDGRLAARVASQSPAGTEAVVELSSTAELPRGAYEVAVANAGGPSGKLKIYVDDLPQAVEAEPNNLSRAATPLAAPAAAWGLLDAKGDVDHFTFDATAGQTLVLDLSAKSLGSKLNGVLTLIDPAGRTVAANNDNLSDEDPLLAYAIAADGRYTVQVNDLQLAGSAEHFYRLSVGPLPLVTGVFPLGVPAEKESRVQLVGYNLPSEASASVAASAAGEVAAPIDAQQYRVRGAPKVIVSTLPESQEQEPNDEPAQATPLALPGTVNGRILNAQKQSSTADVDLYRFEAKAGQAWVVETEAARRGSPVDTRIEVLDGEGRPVERMALEAVRDSSVTFRPINSTANDVRLTNWEEMELNQFLYLPGEVTRLFRLPQGPDSGFLLYAVSGQRTCYFDTSPSTHALDEACYIVEPRPAGSPASSSGLPTFRLYYANDDDGARKLGRDSRLTFTAPSDGAYYVRVQDVRGMSGERFAYRLTVRPPRQDFQVSMSGANAAVFAGGGRNLTFTADRIDGFDESIRIDITGLPPGFHVSTPVEIQPGHTQAFAVLYADENAQAPAAEAESSVKVTATATIAGAEAVKDLGSLGPLKLAPKGKITVRLEPAEVALAPGQTIVAQLKIERNGNDGPVSFNVNNLPHGVYVDNIGLNGVLIPEGQTVREIFLTARPWVGAASRTCFAVSAVGGGEASPPIVLHVRPPANLAQAIAPAGK